MGPTDGRKSKVGYVVRSVDSGGESVCRRDDAGSDQDPAPYGPRGRLKMAARTRRWQIILGVFVVSLYGAVLAHNLNESDRRSLDVKEVSGASDHVAISMHVVAASPRTSDITARLSFRLQGSIAKDPVTPAVDLTLFLNDIRGPQAIVWPRGRRINPIEASFSLTGNENMYPVDYYESEIRVGVSSIHRVASAGQWATPPQQSQKAGAVAGIDGALVLAAEDEGQLVPLAFSIA